MYASIDIAVERMDTIFAVKWPNLVRKNENFEKDIPFQL